MFYVKAIHIEKNLNWIILATLQHVVSFSLIFSIKYFIVMLYMPIKHDETDIFIPGKLIDDQNSSLEFKFSKMKYLLNLAFNKTN